MDKKRAGVIKLLILAVVLVAAIITGFLTGAIQPDALASSWAFSADVLLRLVTSFKLTLRPIGSSLGAHTEGGGVQSPAGSALGAESAEMTGSGCSQEETRPDVFQAGSCKIALELLSCL